jgi:phosphoglycerate dehydrogenase-like enzyme
MKVLVGPNILGLEQGLPDLRRDYPQLAFASCTEREALVEAIADADIYLGWLSRDVFLAARHLKWIQSPSSGIDSYLAIPELVGSDMLLTSARGTHGACLAESALGMILAFTRGIRDAALWQQRRVWAIHEMRGRLVELTGSTLGIVGLGVAGRALARRAQAFDMRIVAVDLCPADRPAYVAELWGLDQLGELLRTSDYVVVTVPRTPQTRRLIGAEQLALMKPGALLVGISRGGVIDQVALAEALRSGHLAAAALDVCDPEPLPADSELWDLDNLLITPHVAGGSQFERQHILSIFGENLGRFLRGDLPLRNQIDKQRGF